MNTWVNSIGLILLGMLSLASEVAAQPTVTGQLQQWHAVTLTLPGPAAAEDDPQLNPFLDIRLEVAFTGPEGRVLRVPGYFAGDGQGGPAGDRWRAHLMPDAVGQWSWQARFYQGDAVAIADRNALPPADDAFAESGTFTVATSDKTGRDMRSPARGALRNAGHHYLTFAGSGAPFVKAGPNIPENLLGYAGFDNTFSRNNRGPDHGEQAPQSTRRLHRYAPHVQHWRPGDPTWDTDNPAGDDPGAANGKGLIGAINDVASTGANCLYLLTMNVDGDGDDTWPTIAPDEPTRYDLSKLDQWNLVFAHAQRQGLLLHLQLCETENQRYHNGGELGPQRKVYYREMVARFAHHPALQWDLGEENDFSTEQRLAFARWIRELDPYDHPISNHTSTDKFDQTYGPLLGQGAVDMTGFQTTAAGRSMARLVATWRQRSAEAGEPWVVGIDEVQRVDNEMDGPHGFEASRRRHLWPALLGGAGGFEWYVRSEGGSHGFDQEIEDLAQLHEPLSWSGHAIALLSDLPLLEMAPAHDLLRRNGGDAGYVLAQPGVVYALYLPDPGAGELNLRDQSGRFELRWFDPTKGTFVGDHQFLQGGGWRRLETPPSPGRDAPDWAAVVRRLP